MIRVKIASIFVTDQAKAEKFYTEVLGFIKKVDQPIGEHRWLTVGNPDTEFELSLEPNAHPAAKDYQNAIFKDGIPATMFYVNDLEKEYNNLKSRGVAFNGEPTEYGTTKLATLNDTCGTWITLCQV